MPAQSKRDMTEPAERNLPAPDLLVLLHEQADTEPPVRLTLMDRMRVAFAGSRGGEGPVTISQGTTLGWVTNPAFPTRMVEWPLSLPSGTSLADIAAALQILMARHESLRTCYPSVPEEPVQRVIRSGELVVEVYTVSDELASDAVLVTGLTGRLRAREFDLTAELPLRVAVAVGHDTPRAAVILFSHMAADMAAMIQLDREFTILVTDPSSRRSARPVYSRSTWPNSSVLPSDAAGMTRPSAAGRRYSGPCRSVCTRCLQPTRATTGRGVWLALVTRGRAGAFADRGAHQRQPPARPVRRALHDDRLANRARHVRDPSHRQQPLSAQPAGIYRHPGTGRHHVAQRKSAAFR